MSETYINTTCQIGQGQPCGRDAVWVIAVIAVADNAWTDETREGGVVALCEFHATTAVTGWDATSAKDTTDRSRRIREAVERSSFGTPEAKAARESVSDEQVARVVARATELDALATVLDGTGVTANTWQSAARRLAKENRRLRNRIAGESA